MTIDERHNAPGNAEDLFGLLAIERTHIQERWFFLHWVCVAVHEISLVAGRGDYSSCAEQASHFGGDFSCYRAQALGYVSSIVVALRLTCPKACGIF